MEDPLTNRHPSFAASLDDCMPMNRIARPAKCAGSVLFLCSEAVSHITGHLLVVDGGFGVRQPLPFPS